MQVAKDSCLLTELGGTGHWSSCSGLLPNAESVSGTCSPWGQQPLGA